MDKWGNMSTTMVNIATERMGVLTKIKAED
jgi:hypothetical protein